MLVKEVQFASISLSFEGDKLNISFENSLENVDDRNNLDLIFKNPEIIKLCRVFCVGLSNLITSDNVKKLSNLLSSLNYEEPKMDLYNFRLYEDDEGLVFIGSLINTYELLYLDGSLLKSLQSYVKESEEIKTVLNTICSRLSKSILRKA
ncbi:MAG: hypothetical protein ACRC7N_10295 [Clostridium sp.]